MALQLGALRDALIEAGATVEKADKAAEEVASYENRLAGIETKLVSLDGRVNLLTWMVGGVYAVVVVFGAPALWLLLRVAAKVGALG
jgi:uncharacterized protein with GYD domain